MIHHARLDVDPEQRQRKLRSMIRKGEVRWGGHLKGKIYGLLYCSAGKRMKLENRVFFASEQEAIMHGYRPCGRCLPQKYVVWKLTRLHGE